MVLTILSTHVRVVAGCEYIQYHKTYAHYVQPSGICNQAVDLACCRRAVSTIVDPGPCVICSE